MQARRLLPVGCALALALALAGCSTEGAGTAGPSATQSSETQPTSLGIEGLTIPTPSVDPVDFTGRLDNPWLAMGPEDVRTFSGPDGTITLQVADETYSVAGLYASSLIWHLQVGGRDRYVADLVAQDTAGNLWWLGRRHEWRADSHGYRAGLLLPVNPQAHDRWVLAAGPDGPLARATVTRLDGDVLTLRIAGPDGQVTVTLERGAGPVRIEVGGEVYAP